MRTMMPPIANTHPASLFTHCHHAAMPMRDRQRHQRRAGAMCHPQRATTARLLFRVGGAPHHTGHQQTPHHRQSPLGTLAHCRSPTSRRPPGHIQAADPQPGGASPGSTGRQPIANRPPIANMQPTISRRRLLGSPPAPVGDGHQVVCGAVGERHCRVICSGGTSAPHEADMHATDRTSS
jgi:hypothetical protein